MGRSSTLPCRGVPRNGFQRPQAICPLVNQRPAISSAISNRLCQPGRRKWYVHSRRTILSQRRPPNFRRTKRFDQRDSATNPPLYAIAVRRNDALVNHLGLHGLALDAPAICAHDRSRRCATGPAAGSEGVSTDSARVKRWPHADGGHDRRRHDLHRGHSASNAGSADRSVRHHGVHPADSRLLSPQTRRLVSSHV